MPARTQPTAVVELQTVIPDRKDELSLEQLRGEKELRRREMFAEGAGGKLRVKQGEDTTALPWLSSCVVCCRGSCLFRACVAREPETPITELHLLQPVLGALLVLAVGFMLLTVAVVVGVLPLEGASLRIAEIIAACLAALSSIGLLYVGRIAHMVPSHEQLNVVLNRRVDWLGESVTDATANAADAERLEGMTLGWVKARGADRDAVRRIVTQLKEDTESLWAFQFKARLLRYLSRGERQRYQQDNAELLLVLRETPDVTLAQYEAERAKLLPNGRLTLQELRRIADVVRQTEQDSAYDFLDEVIYALCDELAASAPEKGWATHHTWSYAETVEAVYAKASTPPFDDRFASFSQVT